MSLKQKFNELLFEFYPYLCDYTDSGGKKVASSKLPLSSGINLIERSASEIPLELVKQENKLITRRIRKGWEV
jgi:hypothetical protein